MKDKKWRYQVKWVVGNETRYGIFRSAANGIAVVEDACMPYAHEVREADLVDIKPNYPSEMDTFIQEAYEKANAESCKIEGVVPGKLFRIGVADGYAYYVVTKVNKKTCTVEWRGFSGDRWQDHHFGLGGKFPISDVARYVRFTDGMAKLFGSTPFVKAQKQNV